MLMMQTEVAEAFEPFVAGARLLLDHAAEAQSDRLRAMIAAAQVVRQHAGLMLDAMAADHERATGPWQLEWLAMPEGLHRHRRGACAGASMLEGLIVEPERMRRNLDLTGGADRRRGGDDGAGRALPAGRRPTTSSRTPRVRRSTTVRLCWRS